jgi:hypothetical protein
MRVRAYRPLASCSLGRCAPSTAAPARARAARLRTARNRTPAARRAPRPPATPWLCGTLAPAAAPAPPARLDTKGSGRTRGAASTAGTPGRPRAQAQTARRSAPGLGGHVSGPPAAKTRLLCRTVDVAWVCQALHKLEFQLEARVVAAPSGSLGEPPNDATLSATQARRQQAGQSHRASSPLSAIPCCG